MNGLARRVERLISLVVLFRYIRWLMKVGPQSALKGVLGLLLSTARKALPGVNGLVEKELQKEVAKFEAKFHGDGDANAVVALPKSGSSTSDVICFAEKRKAADDELAEKKFGKSWGGIYHDHDTSANGRESLQCEIYKLFSQTNALYPAVFTAVRKFEAEVVAMTLSFLGGDGETSGQQCGLLTSGGTESIMIAVLTFREAAKERGVHSPEIVACRTAHPALDKACHYFGVKLVKVNPEFQSQQLRAVSVEKALTKSTIAIFASAPTFPHGVVDAIPEISDLALSRGLLFHVDNCLGGYYLSFLEHFVEDKFAWNFDLPGVSTISIDVHKYGYAPKGVSVVAFRNAELRRKAYKPVIDGPGLYVTPTLQGARGGAQIATAWATLMNMGHSGYTDSVRQLDATFRKFKDAVRNTAGLQLLVESDLAIIPVISEPSANGGPQLNIYAVANQLESRGWGLFTARDPACFSICIGEQHGKLVEEWEHDLQAVVQFVADNPGAEIRGDAAVYGAANSLPDEILDAVVRRYVDTALAVRPAKLQGSL